MSKHLCQNDKVLGKVVVMSIFVHTGMITLRVIFQVGRGLSVIKNISCEFIDTPRGMGVIASAAPAKGLNNSSAPYVW